ncbi:hypothetical protein B0H17DRAFT_1285737 [Mycena rosella]|uniref:Uncharacterized protein n=1 Tax=Mycena rosella TaxID=1033263 RepID=A0AAD7FMS2_MYCRO|nr:hypothetical protein B0H17DRAFT_1285737 [Mycena rosella]
MKILEQNKVKTPEFIEEEIESTNLQAPLPAAQNEERRVDVRLHAMPVFWISLFNTPKATDTWYTRIPRVRADASRRLARHLALHPSALSDADHALFTASLADLADITGDLEHVSVSVREARAWLCGRYAALGSGTVDEPYGWYYTRRRGAASTAASHSCRRPSPPHQFWHPLNPFLPTPAPSPEARACPPLPPRKLTSPKSRKNRRHVRVLDVERLVRPAKDTTRTPPPSSSPAPRRTRSSPRRRTPAPRLDAARSRFVATTHPTLRGLHDAAHRISRRGPAHASSKSGTTTSPSTSTPTRTKSRPKPKPLPPRPAPAACLCAHLPGTARAALPHARGVPPAPRARARCLFAPHPPVQPQLRASAFEAAYGAPASPSHTMYAAHDGRRVSSDSASARRPSSSSSYVSELTRSPARKRTPSTSALPLPLILPKTLRRTLAGTGWVGAERDEREGLVRGGGGYTVRNGRRGAEDGDGEAQEAWGAFCDGSTSRVFWTYAKTVADRYWSAKNYYAHGNWYDADGNRLPGDA